MGHSRKHPYHSHRGNWKLNPPTPFGCPNTFTIIRNNFVSPPPPDGRNFLRGGVWIFPGTTQSSIYFFIDRFRFFHRYPTLLCSTNKCCSGEIGQNSGTGSGAQHYPVSSMTSQTAPDWQLQIGESGASSRYNFNMELERLVCKQTALAA
jgi:hypothetical protein